MPLITIHVLGHLLTEEQKREMIEKVTDTIVAIEGEAMRGMTWALIKEVRESNRGIGGQDLVNAAR